MQKLFLHVGLAVLVCSSFLFAQQASESSVTIKEMELVPSDPVIPTGTCKFSTGGYLQINGRRSLSDTEIGGLIAGYLNDGYIVKAYPATKRGTFVYLKCTNAMASERP